MVSVFPVSRVEKQKKLTIYNISFGIIPGTESPLRNQTSLSFRITPSALPMSPSAASPHMSEDEEVEDNSEEEGDVADSPAVVVVAAMEVCRYC